MLKQYRIRCLSLSVAALAVLASAPSYAADLNLGQLPLYLAPVAPPLNMLVVGRDHKLYYEAYNDASDLNGDGKLDVGYKGYLPNPTAEQPDNGGIDYYGYFDSYKCYTYSNGLFTISRNTANKRCGLANEWSGDYLNYLTTSRIDALRKVLYGGKRDVDTDSATVLIRSHIPMDAHSWGKEYSWDAPADFNISDFAPLTRPPEGRRHLFANTTPNNNVTNWQDNNGPPLLRVLTNQTYRIWEWVSKESPVAGTLITPAGRSDVTVNPTNYTVRVEVCDPDFIDPEARSTEACKQYPNGNYKPTGLLHDFGENDSMMFGLLTGSYTANKSGGVLRKNVGSFRDEVNEENGTWTSVGGIVKTLDSFRVAGYSRYTSNGGTSYDCGLPAMAQGPIADGNCRMWGNPVAEMMYETLKYFNGMSPTSLFTTTYGSNNTDIETALGLPSRPAWRDPYADSQYPRCTKPFQTVMTDINNSYDTDQLPGSRFVGAQNPGDLNGLHVGNLADQITEVEGDIAGREFFIGESNGEYDGSPKFKPVTSLATARGLAPEEPTKEGGYYASSVAYHGHTNPANPRTDERVDTFAVALASPLPRIEIPVGQGRFITLVPFAKSVLYNNHINLAEGRFQPTNQIVDFYVEHIADDQRSGTFQVNFEDVEAGNDHDMDAIVRYSYSMIDDNTLRVNVSSDYQAGGVVHHIGYVISGTTADGVYLVVQDCNKQSNGSYSCNSNDPDYFLDTPPGQGPDGNWNDLQRLPGFSSRTFTARGSTAATLLKDPLWYAAKWGGFKEHEDTTNNIPDRKDEWDVNNDGNPDNYFLVTNALTLSQQLRDAFLAITGRASSATAAAVNGGAINTDTRVFQAGFDSRGWTGTLSSFEFGADGNLVTPARWEAGEQLRGKVLADSRNIITVNTDGRAVPFRWEDGNAGIDALRRTQLHPDPTVARSYLDYLRGNDEKEVRNGGALRNRVIVQDDGTVIPHALGDIISSAPLYVSTPRGRYSDRLEDEDYSLFFDQQRKRDGVVYVGANDGMVHAFRADRYSDPDGDTGPQQPRRLDENGEEIMAFIPKTVFGNLPQLTRPSYSHFYFVDGSPNSNDVYFDNGWHTVLVGGLNRGGQGIYALDVTDPDSLGTDSFLWEINDRTSDAFRDLGYTYSQPAIVRFGDKENPDTRVIPPGVWAAVFGNGYNNTEPDGAASSTGNAVLYVVDIATGELLKKLDTGVGREDDPTGQMRPNGLATPTMVDVDGDRIVDLAYVGDLFGNVWKINMPGSNPNNWRFAFGTDAAPEPFFVARDDNGNEQPITSRIEVTRGQFGGGIQLLFGTGKFLEGNDKLTTPERVQTFYGLYDTNGYILDEEAEAIPPTIGSREELVEQTIVDEVSLTDGTLGRVTSQNRLDGARGWYMDLISPDDGYEGERVVSNPVVRGDRVIFSTLIPNNNNDLCAAGVRGWVMILDPLNGKMLPQAQVDGDGDGVITDPTPGTGTGGNTGGGENGGGNNGGGEGGNGTPHVDPRLGGFGGGETGGGGTSTLTCVSDGCLRDWVLSIGGDGNVDARALRSVLGVRGRQSWRQIR